MRHDVEAGSLQCNTMWLRNTGRLFRGLGNGTEDTLQKSGHIWRRVIVTLYQCGGLRFLVPLFWPIFWQTHSLVAAFLHDGSAWNLKVQTFFAS